MSLSAAQLEVRKHGIGSSDIAAICGEDPMKSAFDVYLDKTNQVANDTNEQMELGHELEPIIAAKFARKFGVELELAKGTMQHPSHPLVLATTDRKIIGTRELVEIKNVGFRMLHKWRSPTNDYVAPANVQIQGQWQCATVGMEAVWIAALIGGRDWYFERFKADPEWHEALISVAEDFWSRYVERRVAPPPDHTEKTRVLLSRLHPRSTGEMIPVTDEITELAREYALHRSVESAAKKSKAAAGNRLRQLIGDAHGVEAEWGMVLWAPDKNGKTSWVKVAKEAGASAELIAKHTGKPARTLRVKITGDEEEEDDDGNAFT